MKKICLNNRYLRTFRLLLLIVSCVVFSAESFAEEGYMKESFPHGLVQAEGPHAPEGLTKYVDPRIGTGGHGHVFFGANVPFGFVQLGPVEKTRGWDWCSGYHASDSVLLGFAHTHLSGTGCGDLGDLRLLPVRERDTRDYVFTHADETCFPGYYSVVLRAKGKETVKAELTTTVRTGFHRYTFTERCDTAYVLFDLESGTGWDRVVDCRVQPAGPRQLMGWRHSSGWAEHQQLFFFAEFSKAIRLAPLHHDSLTVVSFDNSDGAPLLIKVGVSSVSVENARLNLYSENAGWDFDGVARAADESWNNQLSKIQIETSDLHRKRVFYTCLFHTMVAPSVFCDVNGDYFGADGKVHKGDLGCGDTATYMTGLTGRVHKGEPGCGDTATYMTGLTGRVHKGEPGCGDTATYITGLTGRVHKGDLGCGDTATYMTGLTGRVHKGDLGCGDTATYMTGLTGAFTNRTTFSLWDTYRAWHPLSTLIHPELQKDITKTLLAIYSEQGTLPVWHLMGCETNCMVGSPAIPVLADQILKGYDVDVDGAVAAFRTSVGSDRDAHALLLRHGYIPFDLAKGGESVGKGLEYAIAYGCAARIAPDSTFERLGRSYAHYFDTTRHFMRAASSRGTFREPFDPFAAEPNGTKDYTEGNAWQYVWLVPHDIHGLIGLFGSEQAFASKLDSLFVVQGDLGEGAPPDITGLIGQYAHGNEPSHHVAYLYNYVGQQWKTAARVREILTTLYQDGEDGLCGNEDVGQLSAWYVLSAIGFYQVDPAGGRFLLGSPLFDEVRMKVRGGLLTVKAVNNGEKNCFIQSVRLNGQSYKKSYVDFQDICNGGLLEIVMGERPSTFGSGKGERP